MPWLEHSLGGSYPSGEIESVYSTAPADAVTITRGRSDRLVSFPSLLAKYMAQYLNLGCRIYLEKLLHKTRLPRIKVICPQKEVNQDKLYMWFEFSDILIFNISSIQIERTLSTLIFTHILRDQYICALVW